MCQTCRVSPSHAPEVVVVGSGLAGLVCARDLGRAGHSVTIVTAARAGCDGASHRVHALAPWIMLTAPRVRGDSPSAFLADLARRGGGLARPELSEVLANGARDASDETAAALGLKPVGEPMSMPEDSWPRGLPCLPSHGGPLLAPVLADARSAGVRVREHALASGLGLAGERVSSVVVIDRTSGRVEELRSDAVVLACGGVGAVFPHTTTPRWCRGSGLALASAADVLLHRPHLTQALPVTAGISPYFPTTAVLLGGAILVDGKEIPRPRDLGAVTLAIASANRAGSKVWLELAARTDAALARSLRKLSASPRPNGVELTVAMHHAIGGVAIDSWGRTSAAGLYACGEAAGGIQGARRTMGTGLIEAWLFGRRVARAVERDLPRLGPALEPCRRAIPPRPARAKEAEATLDAVLRPLAVVRPPDEVAGALDALDALGVGSAGPADIGSVFAGLRLGAARVILSAELDRGQRAIGAGAGSGSARGAEAEEPWSKNT
jgi:L-aspartate oxidase